MLAFVSDLHLTDGTSGETIRAGAFEKFTRYLSDMAERANARELEVVFLGDIFDVIRSGYWLRSEIRPWSPAGAKDADGRTADDYTLQIVKRIAQNPTNIESLAYLTSFKEEWEQRGVPVTFTYIVGNHDRTLNRIPEARREVARMLTMSATSGSDPFPRHGLWPCYRVFARHGDVYDPFNYEGDTALSSLGDAIVIDLICSFHKEIRDSLPAGEDPIVPLLLNEIDNVRPTIDIPLWVYGVCRRARSKEAARIVKETWNRLADRFLAIEFVRGRDRPWSFDLVDRLELALKLSKLFSIKEIASIPLQKFIKDGDEYHHAAYGEDALKRNEAEFVVYGHTHNACIEPLDIISRNDSDLDTTYFNTGTWRKVLVRTRFDAGNYEFAKWHVMTFVAFYLPGERADDSGNERRRFEVWNGALG